MVKPTRRKKRKASSGSNSDSSPKQETKRNNLDEKVSFPTKSLMAAQIEQERSQILTALLKFTLFSLSTTVETH